ncbi:MAG: DUF192 domain-containing protein [Spirochaetes bacterium]|nr:DUF192 domain-containing protein [Spirochaetota bacterium]
MALLNHFKKLFFLLCLTAVFIGCNSAAENRVDIVVINGHVLNVEIAETERARRTGLMHRKTLDWDSGMLFVFETDRRLSFWMKNTYIPLSIAFISSDGIIREIQDMTPHSLEPVVSRNFVRFALEVNQGYFEASGIRVGDRVTLPEEFRRSRIPGI